MTSQLGSPLSLEPVNGWEGFASSPELVELFWQTLATWLYLNLTSDTSTWECPRHGTLIWLAFGDADAITELGVRLDQSGCTPPCSAHSLLEQIRKIYGIEPRP